MTQHTLIQKLAILSDAAKYDASCASSGTTKRNSADGLGLGSTEGNGICHAYAPDGRCISLLKILMTNFCIYDCVFCVNRASSNVARARFTVKEVVDLTLDFYRRNYIEGLFLSSGIIKSSDKTMEDMVRIVKELRTIHNFRGYIHLKTIPNASQELIEVAGLYADRLSINIELPDDISLKNLAPEKDVVSIKKAMAGIRSTIDEAREPTMVSQRRKVFVPAGQSTQMIIGADKSNDATVLMRSAALYGSYKLKRIYYSAFSPIPDASKILPLVDPPLMREHRLYQADWLMRFYGFEVDEITASTDSGMLDLELDPKLAWALKNRHQFPIDIQQTSRELLLRVPGFGLKTVNRVLQARRSTWLGYADMLRMGAIMNRAQPFVVLKDFHPGSLGDALNLRARFASPAKQLSLFQ